jgi:hypothetical protein
MDVEIRNEFAAVDVRLDASANGPRLLVRDLESGSAALLDAFVLRCLALLTAEQLEALCRATIPVEGPADEPGLTRGGPLPAP